MDFEHIHLQWFAAEDEGRTEDPSEFRLRKAREEGRLPKSQELSGAISFLLTVLILLVMAKEILATTFYTFSYFFSHIADETFSYSQMFSIFFRTLLTSVLPVCLVAAVGGIVSNIIQNKGFIFTLKTITPNLKKIIPNFIEYFKNTLFSFKGFFNIVKSIGKVVLIGFIAYFLIKQDIEVLLMEIQNGQILVCVAKLSSMVFKFLMIVALVFLLISIIDYFVQKKSFMDEMKMTKYDVKQEMKSMEGDPEVKFRLKEAQKQLLQNIPKTVKEADVVITNPTHYAVSLQYDSDVDVSPKVTAKGVDEVALRIKQIAIDNNIPTVENRPLARDLFANVEINNSVPDEYFSIIATIYAEIGKFK